MSSPLVEFIRDLIRREGPMSFARFMTEALYHPALGYYSAGRCSIGRAVDYFTSVSVGPLFGKLIAAQCTEVWEKLGQPNDFTIVEQAAHDGVLARDILEALRQNGAELFARLRYTIIEPFPILRAQQRAKLESFAEKITWTESVEELTPFCGVYFANELLDALPVHLITAGGAPNERDWRERSVDYASSDFRFVEQPIDDKKLAAQIAKLPPAPREIYETEINLAALDWIAGLAPKLQQGMILVADYGFTREEFYAPSRSRGTLQSCAAHRMLRSPFEKIGESDITAHVEWTSVAEQAENWSLTIAGFADQHHFLTGLLATNTSLAAIAAAHNRSLQTLLHPEFLGTRFQFLGLTKNWTASGSLGGFRFARDARARLGLHDPPVAQRKNSPV